MDQENHAFVEETDEYVDVSVGFSTWESLDGCFISEAATIKAGGEVWRIHKSDVDPYPSKPHAHCIDGDNRFRGCTLHLGTGRLYDKRTPLNRKLGRNTFQALLEKIRPLFPGIQFPLID